MNATRYALVIQAAIAIAMIAITLSYANRLLLRHLDDKGMYMVPPFSWLPIISGIILGIAALDAMEISEQLDPASIWLSDYWSLTLNELYHTWLNPFDLLFATVAGLIEFRVEMLQDHWRALIFQGILVADLIVAILAWRSWHALRGIFLFFWLSMTVMVLFYMAVVLLAWITHWLNFWLLLVIFIFLYMYDKEGDLPQRSPL